MAEVMRRMREVVEVVEVVEGATDGVEEAV